jgi:uncharacterized protein YbaR (Trm112 family)
MPLSDQLLEILVCPACKGELEYDRIKERLNCHTCRLSYPIQDDIPIMLIDSAEPIPEPGIH